MELRPYQQKALDAIFHEWDDEGRNRTLLVLPTGTGKTVVFAKAAEECVRRGSRVLILAHRGELLQQAADKIKTATGLSSSTEKAGETSIGQWNRVVVGSVQTLSRASRLERFSDDHFGVVIVDEAHHAISDSYQRVLNYFGGAKVLGVTATPDRGDLRGLGTYFESLAYEYRLPEAIRDGYLCRIEAVTIPLRIDMGKLSVKAGDFSAGDTGAALDPYLEQIAREMTTYCTGRKTVVFLPLVSTAQKFCRILNENGLKAAEVNGNSSDRGEVLEAFNAGEYDVLCNAMLLTEGWDCPAVDCVVVLRPTKVRSLYCQMVGRGTRLSPETGKEKLLLLDFLWNIERHELCRPASLICQDEAVSRKMTENLEENAGVAFDIEEAQEQAEKDAIEEREQSLAAELEKQRAKRSKLVDPLQFELSILDEDLASYVPSFGWEAAPPTEKQAQALERSGINAEAVASAGKASKILDRLAKRRELGLATPKQIRFLEGRGFKRVGTWSFDAASRLINRIAANGWRTPPGIIPGKYEPQEKSA